MIGKALSHYEIVELLGSGGMGTVYRARDTWLERDIALKVLSAELAENDEFRQRFDREVKSLAALRHPNIVTIHSFEEADGTAFYTMCTSSASVSQHNAKTKRHFLCTWPA